jgi:hypothetical protein
MGVQVAMSDEPRQNVRFPGMMQTYLDGGACAGSEDFRLIADYRGKGLACP